MSDIEKIPNDGPSDPEKVAAEDFEGHKLESKIEPKVESDFEGHRMMDSKVEPKFEERVQE